MTYNKPKISKLDGAINAIQGVDLKGNYTVTDTFQNDPSFPTPIQHAAYQADE